MEVSGHLQAPAVFRRACCIERKLGGPHKQFSLFNDAVSIAEFIWDCSQKKFPDWFDNEINNNKNKHSFRSNKKGYGGKTH
jgi:hypothetical protein